MFFSVDFYLKILVFFILKERILNLNYNIKLNISDQDFSLDNLDVHNIEEPKLDLLPDLLIDEIEILE